MQETSYHQVFTNKSYVRLATIPKLEYVKSFQGNCKMIHVWVLERLFFHNYPFNVPNLFQKKLSLLECRVTFKFLQVYTSTHIEKRFMVEEYTKTLIREDALNVSKPLVFSNKQKTQIKLTFIKLVEFYQENNLLEKQVMYLVNNQGQPTEKLTTKNISEGFIVYEKLTISNLEF
jgi:hypothetical protein